MSFFVDKLGPAPNFQSPKEQKSAAGANLTQHPRAGGRVAPTQKAQAAAAPRVQAAPKAAPAKEEPKKKKGWF